MQLSENIQLRDAIYQYFFPRIRQATNTTHDPMQRINKLIILVENVLATLNESSLKDHMILSSRLILKLDATASSIIDPYVMYASRVEHNRYSMLVWRFLSYTCYDLTRTLINVLIETSPDRVVNVYTEEFSTQKKLYELCDAVIDKILVYADVYGEVKQQALRGGEIVLPHAITNEFFSKKEEDVKKKKAGVKLEEERIKDGFIAVKRRIAKCIDEMQALLAVKQRISVAATQSLMQETVCGRLKAVICKQKNVKKVNQKTNICVKEAMEVELDDTSEAQEPLTLAANQKKLQDLGEKQYYERAIIYATMATIYQQQVENSPPENAGEIKSCLANAGHYYNLASTECAKDASDQCDPLGYFIAAEAQKFGIILERHADILLRQAGKLFNRSQYPQALERYEEVPATEKNLEQITLGSARCFAQMGKVNRAIDLLLEYLKTGQSRSVKLELAKMHTKQRRIVEAEALFNELQDCNVPGYERAYFKFLYNAKRHNELKVRLNGLIKSGAINLPYMLALVAKYSHRLGEYEQAQYCYKRLHELVPHHFEYKTACAAFFGLSAPRERALALLNDVIDKHPGYLNAFTEKAKLLAAEGKSGQSVDLIDDLIRRLPSALWLQLTKAQILLQCGMHDKLNRWLEYLVEHYPDDCQVHFYYSRFHTNPNKAILNLMTSIKSSSFHSSFSFNLATCQNAESFRLITVSDITSIQPVNILRAIRSCHVDKIKYDKEMSKVIVSHVKCLQDSKVVNKTELVNEMCNALGSGCFQEICSHWIDLGVLAALLKNDNVSSMRGEIMRIAAKVDQQSEMPAYKKLVVFLQEVLWELTKSKKPLSMREVYIAVENTLLLQAVAEDEKNCLIEYLQEKVMGELRATPLSHGKSANGPLFSQNQLPQTEKTNGSKVKSMLQ